MGSVGSDLTLIRKICMAMLTRNTAGLKLFVFRHNVLFD